jgi:hypothetical protein
LDVIGECVSESNKETEKLPKAVEKILQVTERPSAEQTAGKLCDLIEPITQESCDEPDNAWSKINSRSKDAPTKIDDGISAIIVGNLTLKALLTIFLGEEESAGAEWFMNFCSTEMDKLVEKKCFSSIETSKEKFPNLIRSPTFMMT